MGLIIPETKIQVKIMNIKDTQMCQISWESNNDPE